MSGICRKEGLSLPAGCLERDGGLSAEGLEPAAFTVHNDKGLGTLLHATERILNHKSGTISGVSAIYNRYTYMKEMKHAMHTYENHQ